MIGLTFYRKNHKNECKHLSQHKDVHLDEDMYLIYKILLNVINKRNGDVSYNEDVNEVNKSFSKGICSDLDSLCSHESMFLQL